MQFSDSILFTTTCEGKITNISYKKESNLVINILMSIDSEIENYEILSKDKNDAQVDIIKFSCDRGFINIPNISDLTNEEYAESLMKDFANTKKNSLIDSDILCIGCNYGEFMSTEYIKMTTPIKKSNRGRKKKMKKRSTRKKIGNGKYFNSQITITVKDPEKLDTIDKYVLEENVVDTEIFTKLKSCMYHIKIYTNGKFQVPFVRDEDINTVLPTVIKTIDIVSKYENVKIDDSMTCSVEYIKSIMKNYRFNVVEDKTLIDIKKLRKVISLFKSYYESNKSLSFNSTEMSDNNIYIDKQDTDNLINYFDNNWDVLSKNKITLIKYNNDNYTGFVVKFLTPIDNKSDKETTAAIFDSNKINLYGCNNREESQILKKILHCFLSIDNYSCLYEK
jgi:hypothetical protein